MPDISKITLPSGNTYDIKDAGARELITALQSRTDFLGVSLTELSDGDTTNPISIDGVTGSVTAINGNTVAYGNAEFIWDGSKWCEFGDLSNLGALAYKDTVSLSRGSGDQVLGEATTFTAAASAVSFSGGTTDKVLGSDATFSTSVTPAITYYEIERVTSVAVSASGTDTFIKSYPGTTQKLETTTVPNVTGNSDVTIPNVTSVGAASTWGFAMGTGNDAETLIISGANGSAPTLGTSLSASKVTLGTEKTVATGSLAASGSGASVMTGLGTATTGSAVTGVSVTQQPKFGLSDASMDPTPDSVPLVTGITSASTTTNNKDEVTAVTSVGTGTAAAQTITVGTNDKVKVAKYDDLSVSTS